MIDSTIPPTSPAGAAGLVFKEVCPSGEEHPPIGPPQTFVMQGAEPTTSNVVPFRQPAKEPVAFVRVEDGQPLTADRAELWACGDCGSVTKDFPTAVACCRCLHCGFSCFGSTLHRAHKACHDKAELAAAPVERRAQLFNAVRQFVEATAVDKADYNGAVFDNLTEEGQWFASVDEMRKSYAPKAEYAWAAVAQPLQLDADDILNNAAEAGEHYEELLEQLPDAARSTLEAAVISWNETYGAHVCSYEGDPSTVVVIDWPAYQAALVVAKALIAAPDAPPSMEGKST